MTAGPLPPEVGQATTVLVTVRDAQLEGALSEIETAPLARGTVVLHASGSAEPNLGALRAAGHPSGTFHPLVPLADPDRAPELLRGAWIGIDGDEPACGAARELARHLGAHTLEIPPGEKNRYHAAAVIASNFPAVLLSLGEDLLAAAGLPREPSRAALRSLFANAARNLDSTATPAEALTGPIVRGDIETVRRHVEALAPHPRAMAAYRALSIAALGLAKEAGVSQDVLDRIGTILAGEEATV
ncbi:MAG TPA: DUF2520 domain-containing protein [Gemmatimonadaceae bacterium]|nr:DUF2520 domain-containing protein [Gemmatimonadaceae bacterium]